MYTFIVLHLCLSHVCSSNVGYARYFAVTKISSYLIVAVVIPVVLFLVFGIMCVYFRYNQYPFLDLLTYSTLLGQGTETEVPLSKH